MVPVRMGHDQPIHLPPTPMTQHRHHGLARIQPAPAGSGVIQQHMAGRLHHHRLPLPHIQHMHPCRARRRTRMPAHAHCQHGGEKSHRPPAFRTGQKQRPRQRPDHGGPQRRCADQGSGMVRRPTQQFNHAMPEPVGQRHRFFGHRRQQPCQHAEAAKPHQHER